MKLPCRVIANDIPRYMGIVAGEEYILKEHPNPGKILVLTATGEEFPDYQDPSVPFFVWTSNVDEYFTVSHKRFDDKLDKLLE